MGIEIFLELLYITEYISITVSSTIIRGFKMGLYAFFQIQYIK